MNAEQISIIFAIKDFIKEDENTYKKVELSKKVINLLTKKMIREEKYNFPTNMNELIQFIKTENINYYLGDELEEEPFIDYDNNINEVILKYINEENEYEEIQKIMKKIVDFCREKYRESNDKKWIEIYRQARTFIKDKYIIEKTELDILLYNTFENEEIINIIKDMYEDVNLNEKIMHVCPICKKPLNYTDEKGSCSEICKYYRNKSDLVNLEKTINDNSKYVRLSQSIYKYVLLASIGEIEIYKNLNNVFKDLNIELYPNVDEFDISISNKNILINLDIKDYKYPSYLVSKLKKDLNLSKFKRENTFLVIPNHRVDIYKNNYMKDIQSRLKNEKIDIEVIQEKDLIKKINQIMELQYEKI